MMMLLDSVEIGLPSSQQSTRLNSTAVFATSSGMSRVQVEEMMAEEGLEAEPEAVGTGDGRVDCWQSCGLQDVPLLAQVGFMPNVSPKSICHLQGSSAFVFGSLLQSSSNFVNRPSQGISFLSKRLCCIALCLDLSSGLVLIQD
ncbi:osteocrin isoform X3 [Nothoprocta perdicaria]|uniref:osteocrin isoform X3 n=1 Tax=Nothoprocta perdicaria TaxID=30464 RepID=UPI000E1BF0BB|nr:osteocrin isoform X3 [Nothoprocta perdicaria]